MRRLILAGGVALLLAAPAAAHALGTATLSGDTYSDRGVWDYGEIHLIASGDTADDISFTDDTAGVTAHDPGVLMAGAVDDAWTQFIAVPPNLVCSDEMGTRTCSDAPMLCTSGVGSATCSQKSLDTAAIPELASITADGGPGNDRIVIPQIQLATSNYAYGGSGNDSLDAGYVFGGPGADTLRGFVIYSDQTTGISASDDGVADDGLPGEGDNIAAGSGVQGTPYADRMTLTGDGDAYGEGGDDTVTTHGGSAYGGQGADRVTVTGSGFASGDDGSTTGGDDVIDVRNGVKNLVMCGPGDDTVIADALDDTSYYSDCEHVTVG